MKSLHIVVDIRCNEVIAYLKSITYFQAINVDTEVKRCFVATMLTMGTRRRGHVGLLPPLS